MNGMDQNQEVFLSNGDEGEGLLYNFIYRTSSQNACKNLIGDDQQWLHQFSFQCAVLKWCMHEQIAHMAWWENSFENNW